MNTPCTLCLAGITHDFNNSLELNPSEHGVILPHHASGSCARNVSPKSHTLSGQLSSSALACKLFTLFVTNGVLVTITVAVWSHARSFALPSVQRIWISIDLGLVGLCFLANSILAVLAKKCLNSPSLSCGCWFMGILWFVILVWGKVSGSI